MGPSSREDGGSSSARAGAGEVAGPQRAPLMVQGTTCSSRQKVARADVSGAYSRKPSSAGTSTPHQVHVSCASPTRSTIPDRLPDRLASVEAANPRLVELRVDAEPAAWAAAGFAVADGQCRVGDVRIRFDGERRSTEERRGGITGWTLAGIDRSAELDGLPTTYDDLAVSIATAGGEHPNGVSGIDHLVVFSSDLDRTTGAFEAAGLRCRRLREAEAPDGAPIRQAFFRLGAVIVEVVDVPPEHVSPGDARLWGTTFVCEDLDRAVAELEEGGLIGAPREAVQPGRRIATMRRGAGLGVPVALISPDSPS